MYSYSPCDPDTPALVSSRVAQEVYSHLRPQDFWETLLAGLLAVEAGVGAGLLAQAACNASPRQAPRWQAIPSR